MRKHIDESLLTSRMDAPGSGRTASMITSVDLLRDWHCAAGPKSFCFTYPKAGTFYEEGFIRRHSGAADFAGWHGLRIAVETDAAMLHVTVSVSFADQEDVSCAIVLPTVGGRADTVLSFSEFPILQVNESSWQYVTGITVHTEEEMRLTALDAWRGENGVFVHLPIRGLSGETNEELTYLGSVYNDRKESIIVSLRQAFEGWESMVARIAWQEDLRDPVLLRPGEKADFTVRVSAHDGMVPGGHEITRLQCAVRGGAWSDKREIRLYTMRCLPHPYLYHDQAGWDAVREKIRQYPQYQPAFQQCLAAADAWQVQPPKADLPYCYETQQETNIMFAAYAYALTGKRAYADKAARFLVYFAGAYPKRLRGCSQSYVQEGHFFQHLAIPYDIIHDAGVLSDQEHQQICQAFRLYMEQLDMHIRSGHISNWLVSEIMGAVYCALALQDWDWVRRFVFGNGGMIEQFRHGMFNDGWWHECSVGYNTWVSSQMIHLAHALLPFGVDLTHTAFPVPYNKEVSASLPGQEKKPLSGMYNQKWGGSLKNAVRIKDIFDAVLPFVDDRGVLFGISDSDEKKLTGVHFGSTYDLAYTYYHDPRYIAIMKRNEPDPIFGHPELPDAPEVPYGNAFADNIGILMLRSQAPHREKIEQIQAVLRYGSHGGAHGHFDAASLLSVMRYGRSLFNPEHCWWGYAHFMYKFYVQCSLTKNMVVVDDKMQIPAESRRILFYSGKRLQAGGVEITTPWAYPPYGGMVYYQDGKRPTRDALRARCEMNGCFLPIVEGNEPVYGEMSEYTEPIRQRRIMAVTDDYIVLFDELQGEKPHVYDSLMQFKGFQGMEGAEYTHHTEQFSDNPVSDAQFITDCRWYRADGPTVARFKTIFTEEMAHERMHCDRSNYNIPGVLHMDVHTAWPPQTTQMVGRVAIYDGWAAHGNGYTIPLKYAVKAEDGRVLAQGSLDGWILGRGEIDVPLNGVKRLSFCLRQGRRQDEIGQPVDTPQGCFWGEVLLHQKDGAVLNVGKALRGKSVPASFHNTDQGFGIGRDYKNGRVTIVGTEYPDAIPTSPLNHEEESVWTLDVSDLHAERLTACVGVDAFAGDEDQFRKTYAVRTQGVSARFITVLEPYEQNQAIRKVMPLNDHSVKVIHQDGTEDELTLMDGNIALRSTKPDGTIITEGTDQEQSS